MYELRELEHAVAVAEHRSFRRAANALGISQPGLSRSIRELERRLGARLFDRDRGGVELTAFGEVVVARGRSMLVDRDDLAEKIRLLQGIDTGFLAVDLGPYPAALYGHEALSRFLSEHPRVSCRLRSSQWLKAISAVLARDVDIAIAELSEAEDDPRVHTDLLATHPGWFVCRPDHDVLRAGRVTLESLLQWPWVTSALPSRLGKLLPGDLGRAGRRDATSGRFLPAIEIEMMKGIGRVARESDALAATTLTLVEQELEGGELKVVPFAAPWFRLNAGFITLEGRTLAPAVAPFVSIVRQIAAELAEREEQLRARFASFPTLR